MAKVKVTSRFEILEVINNMVNTRTANELGRAIVDGSKRLMSDGISPVRDYGRFERYKDRKKYPGNLKPARPVNLQLSGELFEAFDYRKKGKLSIESGIIKGSRRLKEIARAHQAGTPNMAQRRMFPGKGEEYAVTIMREIRKIYTKRLRELIRKSNKK